MLPPLLKVLLDLDLKMDRVSEFRILSLSAFQDFANWTEGDDMNFADECNGNEYGMKLRSGLLYTDLNFTNISLI